MKACAARRPPLVEAAFLDRLAERLLLPKSLVSSGPLPADTARATLASIGPERLELLDIVLDAAHVEGRPSPPLVALLRRLGDALDMPGDLLDARIEMAARRYRSDPVPHVAGAHPTRKLTKVPRRVDEPTVLFTDVKSSVEMHEILGDREARDLIRRCTDIQTGCLREHGGELVKTMGDGIFGTFPDTRKAVEATIEMQERLCRWRATTVERYGPLVRAALHRGTVIVEDHDLHGMTVNVVSRLLGTCDADEIVISDAVLSALTEPLAGRFSWAGPVVPKGTQRVLDIHRWRAPWKSDQPTRTMGYQVPLEESSWRWDPRAETYRLVGTSEENKHIQVDIGPSLRILGRSETSHVRVESRRVSRTHAGLVVRRRVCWIIDLESHEGALLRYPKDSTEWRVQHRAPLVVGARIETGGVKWRLAE